MIVGDFNFPDINWANYSSSKKGELFKNTCLDLYLNQLVMNNTRNKNILDLILTNCSIISEVCISAPLGSSDHSSIDFKVTWNSANLGHSKSRYSFNRANYDAIRAKLSNFNWSDLLRDLSTEDSWKVFTTILSDCIEKHVPLISKSRKKQPLWFNNQIKVKLRQKKQAWKTYQENKSTENFMEYLFLERDLKSDIKIAQHLLEQNLVKDVVVNPKRFFGYVNKKIKASGITTLVKDNQQLTNDGEIAEELNNFFSSTFTVEDLTNVPDANAAHEHSIANVTISSSDVAKQLKKLKACKSPGPDNIYPCFLKEVACEITEPLTIIFNKSISESSVVDAWKAANVTPLFKKGPKSKASSYRPISLTSVVCKMLESIIKQKLVQYLESQDVIKPSQHGFRSGRSCLTNLLEYLEYVTTQIDNRQPVDCVYLDFSKAFDKVPHQRLLVKLKTMGIEGKVLEWIRDWLSNRKQRVVLNGTNSKWQPVLSGVPQGSVLGPLLFILYINDLDTGITSNISKFADDTKLFYRVPDNVTSSALQSDLDRLVAWAKNGSWNLTQISAKFFILETITAVKLYDEWFCIRK